jgi:hypothetical protein
MRRKLDESLHILLTIKEPPKGMQMESKIDSLKDRNIRNGSGRGGLA